MSGGNEEFQGNMILETVTVNGDKNIYYFTRDSMGK